MDFDPGEKIRGVARRVFQGRQIQPAFPVHVVVAVRTIAVREGRQGFLRWRRGLQWEGADEQGAQRHDNRIGPSGRDAVRSTAGEEPERYGENVHAVGRALARRDAENDGELETRKRGGGMATAPADFSGRAPLLSKLIPGETPPGS